MEPTQNSRAALLSTLAIPVSIIVAGALIAGGLYLGMNKSGAAAPAANNGQPQKAAVDVKKVKIDAETPYIGDPNAPATLVEWADYQCPFCKTVEVGGVQGINIQPSMPTLKKDYVDTGKLRIVFKDYPFLGEDSVTAALYSHAVWELYPSKWFSWREAMYKAQDAEGDQGFGDETSIIALSKKISGIDAGKLKALVASKKDAFTKIINDERAEGSSYGINGTPGFITGTQSLDGAQPLANFQAAIDPQLK